MDSLDIMDKFYEKKYQDMETRLYHLYDEIEGVENSIEEVKNRLLNIRQQKISEENVYQFLLYFDKLYDKFTDLEKKEFLNSFVEQVDIYEQEQPDGRFLKHIKFRFPVYFWRQGDTGTLLGQRKHRWDLCFIVQTRIKAGRLVNGIRNIAEEIVLKRIGVYLKRGKLLQEFLAVYKINSVGDLL